MCTNVQGGPAPAGLPYTWKTTAEDGSTYSIDKLLLDFALEYQAGQRVLDGVGALVWVEFSHWTTHKMGAFRDQFTFALEGGRSFWLGVGLNGPSGVNTRRARLEFNPNKVGETRALRWVFNLLYDNSRHTDFPPVVVVRWDFAVDLPGERTSYELLKDGRVYEEFRRSASDRTQYVGRRNAPGRCKLYNKTIEAGLGVDVTRLELTLAGDACTVPDVLAAWPRVLRLPGIQQLGSEWLALNETDRFILRTLWQQPERLGELSRRKREKLGPLVASGGEVKLDVAAFGRCLVELRGWLRRRRQDAPPVYGGGWEVLKNNR